jgi:dTDP-4-amino-4,6-dideoxygalactose transaminase
MAIFNSLGSNYTAQTALESLVVKDDPKATQNLIHFLEQKYSGKAELYYKGRHAITRALKILGVKEGDAVAITGFTCYAVYKAIKDTNAQVIFLDIDDSLNFSQQTLEKAIQAHPNIKAVIVQNTLGYPADIEEIAQLCHSHQLSLIEDLAHCIGTQYQNGAEAGTVGEFVTLSFSQDKVVDGISGGALIIRNVAYQFTRIEEKELNKVSRRTKTIDRLYPLLTLLIRSSYEIYIGKLLHTFLKKLKLLSRPVDLDQNGFITLDPLYAQLTLEAWNTLSVLQEHRRQIANIYRENISEKLQYAPIRNTIANSANLRYPIFLDKRDELINYLKKHDMHISDIWYDAPVGPKKYTAQTSYRGECPNAQLVSDKIMNLPTHRNITISMARQLASRINTWYEGNKNV